MAIQLASAEASPALFEKSAVEASLDERTALEETSTVDLVKGAMDQAKELVRLEVALAKEDVKEELLQIRRAAIAIAIAVAASVVVLCLLAVTLVLALGGTAVVSLVVAGVFLLVTGLATWAGYGLLPKTPLGRTRARLESDMNQLKDHIA